MKQAFFTSLLALFTFIIQAQDTPPFPPTGKKDTSFNTPKAFRQIKDKYPDASLVSFPLPPLSKREKKHCLCSYGAKEIDVGYFLPQKQTQ